MRIGQFSEEDVLRLARNAYDEGKAQFEIVTSNCALLVIDMQEPELKVIQKGFAKVMSA